RRATTRRAWQSRSVLALPWERSGAVDGVGAPAGVATTRSTSIGKTISTATSTAVTPTSEAETAGIAHRIFRPTAADRAAATSGRIIRRIAVMHRTVIALPRIASVGPRVASQSQIGKQALGIKSDARAETFPAIDPVRQPVTAPSAALDAVEQA